MMSPARMYRAIQPMMKSADPEDIRRTIENMLDLFPDFARGHNDLGVLLYQAGLKQDAHRHYERAAQLDPDNVVYQKNLADFLYVEMNRMEDTLRIYVRVLELKPDDVETLLVTGHICVACHKFDDAMTFYRQVLEIEPGNETARDYLEKIESRQKSDACGHDPETLYKQAQQLAASGDSTAAIEKLQALLTQTPDEAVAHNDLGVLLYQTGQGERAVRHYERAYRLQPENTTFAKNLADFYYAGQGRIEEALQIYVDILAKSPEDVETLLMTGRICDSLQRFDDARVFYERVLEIEPWNQDAGALLEKSSRASSAPATPVIDPDPAICKKAQALASQGQYQEAAEVLEALIRSEPDDALAHNDLGVLYLQTGQPEKSQRHYERACELAPENTTFKKNLADYYWVQMGRMEEALEAYVEILEILPEDIETLMSLGNVCTALHKFDDARVFFGRVLEIEPWNADAGDKLAELDRLNPVAQTG